MFMKMCKTIPSEWSREQQLSICLWQVVQVLFHRMETIWSQKIYISRHLPNCGFRIRQCQRSRVLPNSGRRYLIAFVCVRESSPSVTRWGFVLCFSTGHWLTGLANFGINGRSVPWPSSHVFSINAASIWWLLAAYWFGASLPSWSLEHAWLPFVSSSPGKHSIWSS